MRIASTGNVGIGTTAPNDKLSISGTGTAAPAGSDSTGHNYTSTYLSTDDYALANYGLVKTMIASATSSSALWGGSIGGNIWGLNSGNIGVGTTTPGTKLDVYGGAIRTNSQLISTVATGTAPLVVYSNTKVGSLNADFLDGVDGATYYKTGDVVMNTNSFGGRSLYINSINDAMFRADSRWVVTGSYYNASDDSLVGSIPAANLSRLFDGDYESTLSIPAGQYAVVNVNFSTESGGNYPGYPYGNFYLSHYYNQYSSTSTPATVRTYSNYAPHGIGWHSYTFSTFSDNGSSALILKARNDVYNISQAEFKIYAPSSSVAGITEIDWQLDRPGSNEMPLLDKYKANSLYSPLGVKYGTSTNIYLNNSGSAYFTGNVGIGTTAPNDKLSISGTGTAAPAGSSGTGHNYTSTYLSTDDYALANYGLVKTMIASATSSSALWGGSVGGNIWGLNSGNVGIGTTTIPEKLTISGGGLSLRTSGLSTKYILDTNWNASAGDFFSIKNSSSANPQFLLSSAGNVGIGTTAPSQKLDVSGKIALDGTTIAYRPTTMTGTLIFGNGGGSLSHTTGTEGYYNTFIGLGAGNANTIGAYNTAIGFNALLSNTSGGSNLALGHQALASNTTGGYNIVMGINSMYGNIDGSNNTAIGYDAGRFISGGTVVNTTGDYNMFLGRSTKALSDNDQNEIVIGYNTTGIGSNSVTLGNDSIATTALKGSVGIGTTAPNDKLSISGTGTAAPAGSDSTGHNYTSTYLSTDDYALINYGTAKTLVSSASLWGGTAGGNIWNLNSGSIGIGTTDPGLYKMKVVGDVGITGILQTQTGSDFAEEFAVEKYIAPGSVVVMGDIGYKSVKASDSAYDSKVVGIVSDNPSIIAGRVSEKNKVVVAMAGVVKVKVVSSGGPIERGDLLTTSEIEGYAMKADKAKTGTIIGKALESLSGNRGEIKVMVNLQ